MSTARALGTAFFGGVALMYSQVCLGQGVTTSSTLSDLLLKAEERSADVLAAQASLDAARARAVQAGYRPNPEATLDVEGFGGTGLYSGLNAAETTLSVAQRFEVGGKRGSRVSAAQAEILVAQLELASARADVRREVRNSFAEVMAGQNRIQLAQEAVNRAEELARVARLLVEAGREPPLRELRANTALSEARAALAQATANDLASRSALASLYGATDNELILPTDEAGRASNPALPLGSPVDQRLDVQLADARLAAARAVVNRERALGVPDVTAGAGVRHYSESGDQALVAQVSVPLPIHDRNRGATAAASAEATAAEIRRNQTLLNAARAERDAAAALDAANAQVAALSGSTLPGAREALRLAELGYREGKFTLLDVLDAQAALNQAQSTLVDAQLNRDRALATLERARASEIVHEPEPRSCSHCERTYRRCSRSPDRSRFFVSTHEHFFSRSPKAG